MITIGDTQTSLELVQVIPGLGSAMIKEYDPTTFLDVAQWEPHGYFCEFQNEVNGGCDSGSVSWGTSDPYEPKFCTKHFFSGDTGYEFVFVAD
jgi:hypothetical protein